MPRKNSIQSREKIIHAIQNPLGFFVLIVLVIEGLLSIVAGAVDGFDRTMVIVGMLILIFILIIVVAFMAYYRPSSLYGSESKLDQEAERSNLDLNSQIRDIVNSHPKLQYLDILAIDTRKSFPAFEDLNFYVDTIRILMHERVSDPQEVIKSWKTLQDRGTCKKLEVKIYSSTPTFYGILLDRKYGCFGFFEPQNSIMGEQAHKKALITGPYLLSQKTPLEEAIISDIQMWFDYLFENYSNECALNNIAHDRMIKPETLE